LFWGVATSVAATGTTVIPTRAAQTTVLGTVVAARTARAEATNRNRTDNRGRAFLLAPLTLLVDFFYNKKQPK